MPLDDITLTLTYVGFLAIKFALFLILTRT